MDIQKHDLTGSLPSREQHVCHTKTWDPGHRHTSVQILICHSLTCPSYSRLGCYTLWKIPNSQGSCGNEMRRRHPSSARNRHPVKVSFLLLIFAGICKLDGKVTKRISLFPRLAFYGAAPLQDSLINTRSSPSPTLHQFQQGLISLAGGHRADPGLPVLNPKWYLYLLCQKI